MYGAVERKIEQLKMSDLDLTKQRLNTAYKYLRFLHYVAAKRDVFFDVHRDPLRPLEGFKTVAEETEDARWGAYADRAYDYMGSSDDDTPSDIEEEEQEHDVAPSGSYSGSGSGRTGGTTELGEDQEGEDSDLEGGDDSLENWRVVGEAMQPGGVLATPPAPPASPESIPDVETFDLTFEPDMSNAPASALANFGHAGAAGDQHVEVDAVHGETVASASMQVIVSPVATSHAHASPKLGAAAGGSLPNPIAAASAAEEVASSVVDDAADDLGESPGSATASKSSRKKKKKNKAGRADPDAIAPSPSSSAPTSTVDDLNLSAPVVPEKATTEASVIAFQSVVSDFAAQGVRVSPISPATTATPTTSTKSKTKNAQPPAKSKLEEDGPLLKDLRRFFVLASAQASAERAGDIDQEEDDNDDRHVVVLVKSNLIGLPGPVAATGVVGSPAAGGVGKKKQKAWERARDEEQVHYRGGAGLDQRNAGNLQFLDAWNQEDQLINEDGSPGKLSAEDRANSLARRQRSLEAAFLRELRTTYGQRVREKKQGSGSADSDNPVPKEVFETDATMQKEQRRQALAADAARFRLFQSMGTVTPDTMAFQRHAYGQSPSELLPPVNNLPKTAGAMNTNNAIYTFPAVRARTPRVVYHYLFAGEFSAEFQSAVGLLQLGGVDRAMMMMREQAARQVDQEQDTKDAEEGGKPHAAADGMHLKSGQDSDNRLNAAFVKDPALLAKHFDIMMSQHVDATDRAERGEKKTNRPGFSPQLNLLEQQVRRPRPRVDEVVSLEHLPYFDFELRRFVQDKTDVYSNVVKFVAFPNGGQGQQQGDDVSTSVTNALAGFDHSVYDPRTASPLAYATEKASADDQRLKISNIRESSWHAHMRRTA